MTDTRLPQMVALRGGQRRTQRLRGDRLSGCADVVEFTLDGQHRGLADRAQIDALT